MLTRTSRVFFEELRRWYREASGIARSDELKVEAGAITFVHRGGGSLNLHVHLHVIAADGVWRCPTDGSTPVFVATRPPTQGDLEGVLVRVAERVAKAIERAGDGGGDGDGDSARDAALEGCRRAASARGEYGVVRDGRAPGAGEVGAEAGDEARFGRRPPKAQVGALEGFNLHASVVIGATDHQGRERLLRYVARPTVASGRVSELADGRVAWLLKVPGGRGETHRINGADGIHGPVERAGASAEISVGKVSWRICTEFSVAHRGGSAAVGVRRGEGVRGFRGACTRWEGGDRDDRDRDRDDDDDSPRESYGRRRVDVDDEQRCAASGGTRAGEDGLGHADAPRVGVGRAQVSAVRREVAVHRRHHAACRDRADPDACRARRRADHCGAGKALRRHELTRAWARRRATATAGERLTT
jgi:hypothetical protein